MEPAASSPGGMTAHASRTGHEARAVALSLVGASASDGSSPASARASSSWAPTFIGDTVGAPRPPDNSPPVRRGVRHGREQPIACAAVSMPFFTPGQDPGPDFAELLRRSAVAGPALTEPVGPELRVPHGTTVVAVRYLDGVVLAGDRRATSGNLISHRSIEKVFPADQHSGVAIAGAAGPAIEMVKLFQLQLEHYEKVEGAALSLEGKANQLGQMVRNHLPAAMQGLAVVPLFAGFDVRRGVGRLFQYDVTGGRYEEHEIATTGSGSLHAGTVLKLGWREDLQPRPHHRPGAHRAVHGRRRGLRHGRPRPHPGHLPGRGHHHRRRVPPGRRRRARGALAPAARRVRGQTASPHGGADA